MNSEILLYGYGAVCICMLIFNIIYSLAMKQRDRKLVRRSSEMSTQVRMQLQRLRIGGNIDQKHIRYLRRRLSHVNHLLAFDQVREEYLEDKDDPAVERYRQQIQPVILHLAMVYWHREMVQTAYFAYFLSKFKPSSIAAENIMLEYLKRDNLYCRVNALQALYEFGSEENVVRAVVLMDRSGSIPHEKILTDGLLTFHGNHKRLIAMLWQQLEEFSERTKLSILNYIRYKSGDYRGRMYEIMADSRQNKELRLSAIRYLGKYPFPPAKAVLMRFAGDRDPLHWEYAAISVTALANYAGQDVVNLLMEAAHSSNWYVRLNAAISLEAHQLDYSDLIEVVGGNDRYAREMMMYRLDLKRLSAEGQEAVL